MLHHDPLEAVLDSLFYDLPLMREAVHDLYPADADDLEEPF